MNVIKSVQPAPDTSNRPEFVESDKGIFCIFDGRSRYVPTGEVLHEHRSLGAIRKVDHSVIEALRLGPQLPTRVFPSDLSAMDFAWFRQYISRTLYGSGVEFGAGPRPMAIPARCRVRYADIFTADEFAEKSTSMRGKDDETRFVHIDLQDSMDEMKSLEPSSVDFLIGSHVIEHVRSPLRVLKEAFVRLRDGGSLILVIPDRDRTFDRNRTVTSFDHHLADFYMPSRERDFEHYVEGSRIVEGFNGDALKERVLDRWERKVDTHMHTFTPESFREIAEWACSELGFSTYELYDGKLQTASDEFYVCFRK